MPDKHKMTFNEGDALTEQRVREIVREEIAKFEARQQRAQSRRLT